MTRPDFLVIGAMKCGTSTVCAYLEAHPQVFMVPGAEPNFFSRDEIWERGPEAYEALFANAGPDHLRVGEGTNDYANAGRFPHAAARIAGYRPDMRLIYLVRDPVARMRSDWLQRRVDNPPGTPNSVEAAIRTQPEIFLDQSLYHNNLQRYRAHFPDSQIFVGFLEDLNRDPQAFFDRLCDFLEIPHFVAERTHANPSAGKRLPTPAYDRASKSPFKRLVPKILRKRLKRALFTKPVKAVPKDPLDLPPDMARTLREDARAFLAQQGKPAEFWSLDDLSR